MTRQIALTNSARCLSDDQASLLVQAFREELAPTFCPEWQIEEPLLAYFADPSKVSPNAEILDLAGAPPIGEDGVLGEHAEIRGQVRGVVYARYGLDNGDTIFANPPDGATTIASTAFHELLELLIDPFTNDWWDGPITVGGDTYASVVAEVCDPVEATYLKRTIAGEEIWLSNAITRAWRDPQALKGPFDFAGILKAPFTLTPESYVIVRNEPGTEQSIFSERMPAYRRALHAAVWNKRLRASR